MSLREVFRKRENVFVSNVQLLEGATGNHIWAEKYDRDLEDIFDLQDEITSKVVRQIKPELERVEFRRVQSKSKETMDAWDLFQRGRWALYSGQGGLDDSREWFNLAERADEHYVDATAMKVDAEAASNFLFNKNYDLRAGYEKLTSVRSVAK